MPIPLLTTKLLFPPARANLVPRPRLTEQLNAGLSGPLTLISAPAGYGKTSLICAWRASFTGRSFPLAWLSLDPDDNDTTRFLAYLIAAIGTIKPGFGEITLISLLSPQPPPPQTILTNLINELSEFEHPFALALDDYHVISTQPIHEALSFILDHLPAKMHLVILSRADPPLPLARLRVRNQLTEIRASDLRFTPEEAAMFFNSIMGLALSAEDVAALERRTEGWIAGLQLAALSLQGRDDPTQFIATFGGSSYYIVDYLVEEVLNRQSESLRLFLMQTSILERLSGPLCDAVTGQTGGESTLEQLVRTNLFVTPIGGEYGWHRYHHLFAEAMHNRLRQIFPGKLHELHIRAADWFEKNHFIGEAIHHALAADDPERAAQLVEHNAKTMLMQGELVTFLNWLKAIKLQGHTHPWLNIYQSWALVQTGRQEQAGAILDQVEVSALPTADLAELAEMRGHIAAIRAHIAAYQWDAAGTIQFARQSLDLLPPNELSIRSFVTQVLGGAYLLNNDLEGASKGLTEARRIGLVAGNLHVAVLATFMLGNLQADQGHLHQAIESYRQALHMATTPSGQLLPVAARAYNGMTRIFYEWNDLEAVRQYAQQCIELSQKWGNINALVSAHVTLARVKQAQGDLIGAQTSLDEAVRLAHDYNLAPGGAGTVEAFQVRLWLAMGNLDAATRWIQKNGFRINDAVPPLREAEYRTFARVLLAQNEIDSALVLVNHLLDAAESSGKTGAMIELLILQSLILQANKEIPQALKSFERALTLALPEGYMRTFLDEGAPMAKLLRQAGSRGIEPRFVSRLLSEFDKLTTSVPRAQQPLIDPLSERELEVLSLIAAGKSNQEIASELVLSPGTIKSHLSHIFGKLNVESRTQCVARARELNLLN